MFPESWLDGLVQGNIEPVRTKAQGILEKLQSYHFQFLICCYLNVLELIAPASKMFEEEELMPYKARPIINETILSLNYAIQCDVDEDMLSSYLASFKVSDGSVITTVIQVELLQMRFVQKESYEVSISEKKKESKSY